MRTDVVFVVEDEEYARAPIFRRFDNSSHIIHMYCLNMTDSSRDCDELENHGWVLTDTSEPDSATSFVAFADPINSANYYLDVIPMRKSIPFKNSIF